MKQEISWKKKCNAKKIGSTVKYETKEKKTLSVTKNSLTQIFF